MIHKVETIATWSYAALWLAVTLEAACLHYCVKKSSALAALYRRLADRRSHRLMQGAAAPELERIFGVTSLDDAPANRSAILLFANLKEAGELLFDRFEDSVHALWHKASGQLYVICQGQPVPCTAFVDTHAGWLHGQRVNLVVDPQGRIASAYQIHHTPQAVTIDSDGLIDKYGAPLSRDVQRLFESRHRHRESSQPVNTST